MNEWLRKNMLQLLVYAAMIGAMAATTQAAVREKVDRREFRAAVDSLQDQIEKRDAMLKEMAGDIRVIRQLMCRQVAHDSYCSSTFGGPR